MKHLLLISLFILSPACAAKPVANAPDSHAAAAHSAPSRMTGWEAFSTLQNGNMRFYEGRLKHPALDPSTREGLATGQKPHTIVLSCSDSRVPPESVFDQGLGDIFTVRIAGNVASTEAIASIEYAVEHLGSRLILVMGHESCGAVGAAIGSKRGVSVGSESLDTLIGAVKDNLTSSSIAAANGDKTFRVAVKENVSGVMKDLLKHSSIVREAVGKKNLILAKGVYSLKTGRVEFWDVGSKFDIETPAGPAIVEPKVEAKPVEEKKAHSH